MPCRWLARGCPYRRADTRAQSRHRLQQPPDSRIAAGQNRLRTLERDECALVDDSDAIGQRKRLAHVVRDDHDRLADLLPEFDGTRRAARLASRDREHRTARPSAAPAGRPRAHGPRRRAAAGRRTIRPAIASGSDRRGSPTSCSSSVTRACVLAAGHRSSLGITAMLSLDGQMREQADVLKHVSDPAAEDDRIPVARGPALDDDFATIRQQQAVDQLENRRLAGAAPPDEGDDVARLNRQAELIEHRTVAGPSKTPRRGIRSREGPSALAYRRDPIRTKRDAATHGE